ncbi:MAG TPA: Nif3-like dinuclear metal center hexameric protein [Archaeoglobaceae archaeon]|nr:Nif3-like dinuclear metal center hexameric protein [Archaeoglobaceae archaeon]
MKLEEIVNFLDEFLKIKEWEDRSMNGLQVEGKNQVGRIAFAVDACIETFREAKKANADMLVVHHGIIWGGINSVRGLVMRRLKFLLENEISLYAAHLPLDAHPEVGNNAELLRIVGARIEKPFGIYHGKEIGYSGILSKSKKLEDIKKILDLKLGVDSRVLKFGKDRVKKIAAVSGGGAFAVPEAGEKGIELFITGEAEHNAYHAANESSLNVIFAGHYTTETLGVRALMRILAERFDVEVEFIDVPTSL